MTVKELKNAINCIDEKYDNVEAVLPGGQYQEGYDPIGGLHIHSVQVRDNFAKTDEGRELKPACVIWLT